MTQPRQVVVNGDDVPMRHALAAAIIVAQEAHEELARESALERQEAARKRQLDELRQASIAAASVQASLAREALLVLTRYAETPEDHAWFDIATALSEAADAALREVHVRDAAVTAGIAPPRPLLPTREDESSEDLIAEAVAAGRDVLETLRSLRGSALAKRIGDIREEAASRQGEAPRGRVITVQGPVTFTVQAHPE